MHLSEGLLILQGKVNPNKPDSGNKKIQDNLYILELEIYVNLT